VSTGRLNNPLYDERGQFIGNQQPEANMFYGFNPMGAIGTGVSSGAVPAVANPLDSAPAGGGKGGVKGGGFASPPPPPPNMYGGVGYNAIMGAGGIRPTSTPAFTSGFTSPAMTPSQGKGGGMQGKGGGMPPPPPAPASSGKGGGKGGGMPSSPPDVSRVSDAVNLMKAFDGTSGPPAPAGGGTTPSPKGGGKGGEIPNFVKDYAGRIGQPRMSPPIDVTFGGGAEYGGVGEGFRTQPQQPAPPAGGGFFGGLANAANLVNQQRQRNDFINSDNELNRIRGAQMELERKARQEAINRSYYDQPAEPTVAPQPAQPLGPTLQPAQMVDPVTLPVSYDTYMENFRNPEANRFYGLAHPMSRKDFEAKSPEDRLKAATFGGMASLPASRNPYDRGGLSERERLDMAYRNRLDEQQQEFLDQRKFLSQIMNRPTPSPETAVSAAEALRPLARRQPLLGAGLGALAMGGNPFMR